MGLSLQVLCIAILWDLYGVFKLGIRNLSIVDKEKKCPLEYKAGDDALVEYMEALINLEKAMAHKSKFETNQKNWLNELAKKRKAIDDKRKDAAKHRQTVAAASEQLVEAFKSFSTTPAQAESVGVMVEEKIALMKMQIMQEIGVKMDESNTEFKDTLNP